MQVREQTSVRNDAATESRRMLHRVAETQIHKRSRVVGTAAAYQPIGQKIKVYATRGTDGER